MLQQRESEKEGLFPHFDYNGSAMAGCDGSGNAFLLSFLASVLKEERGLGVEGRKHPVSSW